MQWTTLDQTGWARSQPQQLAPFEVTRRIRVATYDPRCPGFHGYCRRRLGFGPLAGVQTLAVRQAQQDAWDVFTPLRDCMRAATQCGELYVHGVRIGDELFDGAGRRHHYPTGTLLHEGVGPDDPRLAALEVINAS